MTTLFPSFVVVCALLVVAGVAKVRSPLAAHAVLRAARLPVPPAGVRLLGVAEVMIGATAAVRPTALMAALVATAYAVFGAFVLWARPDRCGCFGTAAAGGGVTHAVLNAAACAVAVIATLLPPPGVASIVGQRPVIAVPLALGMIAGAFAAYLVFTAFPAAWHAYGAEDW